MKSARLILGLYVLVWFTIIVPSHTRGIVGIPGMGQSISCCPTAPAGDSDPTPCPPANPRNCGICLVAATYSLPPVYVFYVRPLDLIEALNDHAVAQLLSLDYPTPFWPVGPPASA